MNNYHVAFTIADAFNCTHQSHGPTDSHEVVLGDLAQRIGHIFEVAGFMSKENFLDLASMSGIDVGNET